MNAHARTALARLRLAAIGGGMTVEDADANCREVELYMALVPPLAKMSDELRAHIRWSREPVADDSLPEGWRQVYDFDKADYSEGYDHVSGAWCRRSVFDPAEWFCAASVDKHTSPIKCVTPLAAMAAALRGGK